MYINFNGVDLIFECHRVIFEREASGLESFWNDTSFSLCVHTERERKRERLRYMQKDSSANLFHSNSIPRHLNTRSTPLKLIYIV